MSVVTTLIADPVESPLSDALIARAAQAAGAKPKVAAGAAARLDHADLTALLYAQGIPREEFVT
jgi:phosphoserine phosphatase